MCVCVCVCVCVCRVDLVMQIIFFSLLIMLTVQNMAIPRLLLGHGQSGHLEIKVTMGQNSASS